MSASCSVVVVISTAAGTQLASTDMACTAAATSLFHGETPLVTGWADLQGKVVCSDEFGLSGAWGVSLQWEEQGFHKAKGKVTVGSPLTVPRPSQYREERMMIVLLPMKFFCQQTLQGELSSPSCPC